MRNPLSKLSPQGRRIYYTVLALFVFGVGLYNCLMIMVFEANGNDQCAWRSIPGTNGLYLITDVVKGGVTNVAGVRDGDTLYAINGKDVRKFNAQRVIDQVGNGEYAKYTIHRASGVFETNVQILKTFNLVYLANFLLGLGFLLVGYIVVMTKPQGLVQRMFAHYSIAAMMFFSLMTIALPPGSSPVRIVLLLGSFAVGHIIAPPLFVRFFFLFPVQRPSLQKRWLTWFLYIFGTLIFASIFILQRFANINLLIVLIFPYVFYIAGLLIFTHSYFTRVEKDKRKPLIVILYSALIGIAAFAYILILGTTNVFLIFLNPLIFIPGVLIINVPIAFGYSIFRYRLMDTELIIKRSLIYGIVTTSLAVLYLLIVTVIGDTVSSIFGTEDNKFISVFAFIMIALAFDPVKRRTQSFIDRRFYAERYNYQKALLEFSQELPRLMNPEEILHSVVNTISSTMHVEKVAVVLCDRQKECYSVSRNIPEEYSRFVQEDNSLISLLSQMKRPLLLALLDEEPETLPLNAQDREKILRSGIILSVPMFIKERLIGTINVGPKMSGKVYSQEDIDLLSTVAGQAAIAIENGILHLSELEKQKMEEQLQIARNIQQSLLPKHSPVIDRLDIAGISVPALSVGGDYFDYIQLGQKKLLVVVADVSGKGMSAALYMSKIQGMIQLASHMYDTPRDMLIHVNRRLYDGIERKSFITMVLALFDLEKNTVQICRAGHNRAILCTNGSFEYLNSTGIGLGLERGPIFEQSLEEAVRPLNPESIFFFYSDGLSEAMNEQHEQYGEETITQFIESHKSLPAQELQDQLMRSVKQFQGLAEQHDDITWVLIKHHKVEE